MSDFKTRILPNGTRLQSGIPKRQAPVTAGAANGLLMRGVVVATYVTDSQGHPVEQAGDGVKPTGVYCDVLAYPGRSNQRWVFLPRCLVTQDQAGMQSGRVWKPRAATMDITGDPLDVEKGTLVSNMDGDHVLVGFLDNNLSQPVILGGIPHPSRDEGCDEWDVGHRTKLKEADGDPDFLKHKGAYFGISDAGDFVVDTTRSFKEADLQEGGIENVPAMDGSTGNYTVKLQKGAKLRVEIDLKKIDSGVDEDTAAKPAVFEFDETGLTITLEDGGLTLKSAGKDGNATLKVGDGAKHVTIEEHLKDFYTNSIKKAWDSHTHPTGMGPSGPPVETPVMDPWDASIQSTKVTIPDG